MSAHQNPYRNGLYNQIFAYLKQKQVVTRAELLEHTIQKLGKKNAAAQAAVTVILSPRKSSKRGDCRGNISSCGELYYMEKLPRQVRAGVKEPQKFRLRWREVALAPRKRESAVEVKQVKTATKVTTKAPAKVTTNAQAAVEVKA